MKLCVNVDHVATLRQARRAAYPDPVAAALAAEEAGAHGITVHLRGDRRHIQDRDVERLREVVAGKLNLEMAATAEMLEIALALRPDQVTLVPERPEEVTTEGGLDLGQHGARFRDAAEALAKGGIATSLFVDPDPRQLEALTALPRGSVEALEINTDAYSRASDETAAERLAEVAAAACVGAGAGLRVFAGHGINLVNVGRIAVIPEIEELNIGHFLVARAVLVGMPVAVREMLAAMHPSSDRRAR